jgi:HAD superfamily hydrolase (TIGR01549 family)
MSTAVKPQYSKASNNPTSACLSASKLSIDAVLFDLFDTLVLIGDGDVAYLQSLLKMHDYLSRNGLDCSFDEFNRAYLKVVDKIEAETATTLKEPHFTDYVERTLADLNVKLKGQAHLTIQAVERFSEEFAKHVSLDPQAVEVLEFLKGKCKIAVISNLTFSECGWEILEHFDLKKYIDLIVVSGDINLRKPHPEIFNMALRYLGVKPSRALFIGDTLETDIMGSRNAGLTSVHINRRKSINSIIKPHFTITNLEQLIHICDAPVGIIPEITAAEPVDLVYE